MLARPPDRLTDIAVYQRILRDAGVQNTPLAPERQQLERTPGAGCGPGFSPATAGPAQTAARASVTELIRSSHGAPPAGLGRVRAAARRECRPARRHGGIGLASLPQTRGSRPRGATTFPGFRVGSRPGSVVAHCGRYLVAARGGALAAPLNARLGQRCYSFYELSIR